MAYHRHGHLYFLVWFIDDLAYCEADHAIHQNRQNFARHDPNHQNRE